MFSFEGPDRRKEEDRIRSEGRLPPGQSLTNKFPVLHYGPVPHFNPATWNLRVWGEVEEEKVWTWDEFNQLPRTKIKMDIHCVTRWSKFDTVWEGVSVKSMVENGLIKIKKTATHVMQHAEYGFTVNLPLEVVLQDNFLLATHLNGEPITPDHGYPCAAWWALSPAAGIWKHPIFGKAPSGCAPSSSCRAISAASGSKPVITTAPMFGRKNDLGKSKG